MSRLNLTALILCAAYIAAVFAPWVSVFGALNVSMTQGGDAPILIGAAIVTALLWWRFSLKLVTPIVTLITAALMTYEVYDVASKLIDAKHKSSSDEIDLSGLISPSWGIYLAAIVSVALVVVAVLGIAQRRTHRKSARMAAQPIAH